MSRVSPTAFDSNQADFSEQINHINNVGTLQDVQKATELLEDLNNAKIDRLKDHVRDKIRILAASVDWRHEFTSGRKAQKALRDA